MSLPNKQISLLNNILMSCQVDELYLAHLKSRFKFHDWFYRNCFYGSHNFWKMQLFQMGDINKRYVHKHHPETVFLQTHVFFLQHKNKLALICFYFYVDLLAHSLIFNPVFFAFWP